MRLCLLCRPKSEGAWSPGGMGVALELPSEEPPPVASLPQAVPCPSPELLAEPSFLEGASLVIAR